MSNAQSRRRALRLAVPVSIAILAAVLVASAQQNDRAANAPRAAQASDAAAPHDAPQGASSNLLSLSPTADLVADANLVGAVSHIPAPLRITVTDYVFEITETLKGDPAEKHVTIRNVGGELPNGVGMETADSFKLTPKNRYLIAATKTPTGYELKDVWQVSADGSTVADANGRVVVGLQSASVLTRPEPAQRPLRYLVPAQSNNKAPPVGPPTSGSHPVAQAEAAPPTTAAAPVTVDQIKKVLRARAKHSPVDDLPPKSGGQSSAPTDQPPSMIAGGYVSEPNNFYTLLSNNNNWDWFQACAGNWNQLVGPSPSGRNWLIGFFNDASGNPIRNEIPKANNGRNNLGVATDAQMTAGGYSTWGALGANGVCYRWYETTNGRLKEVDVLINPAIASDEAQYRKSLTHELGHAMNLDHEDRYFALLYPGTWRQPPNYSSWWYARSDDMHGVRSRLEWVNANIAANRWNLLNFADMTVWSQAHEHPGTSGNLVMTSASTTTVNRGSQFTFRNVQIENRGNSPASNVTLKFYLSWNPIISNIDTEIASYTWASFPGYGAWSGSLNATVPSSLAPGTYYAGWVVTSNVADLTNGNNTALLLKDSSASFAPQTMVVH